MIHFQQVVLPLPAMLAAEMCFEIIQPWPQLISIATAFPKTLVLHGWSTARTFAMDRFAMSFEIVFSAERCFAVIFFAFMLLTMPSIMFSDKEERPKKKEKKSARQIKQGSEIEGESKHS